MVQFQQATAFRQWSLTHIPGTDLSVPVFPLTCEDSIKAFDAELKYRETVDFATFKRTYPTLPDKLEPRTTTMQ